MTKLENTLKKFRENGLSKDERCIILNNNETPISFCRIAKDMLSGYFEVSSNGVIMKVIPTAIEIYYHEENGDIKDNIVYHRNTNPNKEVEPFLFGILHNHVSGIDITFESKNNNNIIRASALIREYKVIDAKNNIVYVGKDKTKEIEDRSTQLYENLYSQFSIFNGFSIIWKDGEYIDESMIEECVRKNVAEYDDDGNKKKEPTNPSDMKTENKKFIQCQRKWQFRIK